MNHTPGPWRVGINRHTIYRDGGKEECIAFCPTNEVTGASLYANARLIAAAPRMLEFVKIVDLAMTSGPNKADVADLRRRARALLREIEG